MSDRYGISSNKKVIKNYLWHNIKEIVMEKKIFLAYFLFFCLLCGTVSAISAYQNESYAMQASDLVVQGKIVDAKSAWNAQKTHIVTIAQVQVTDSLKNTDSARNLIGSTVEVSVLGGTVGNETEWVEDMPTLIKDTNAIFFLKKGNDGQYSVLKISGNENAKGTKSFPTTLPVTAIPTTPKAGTLFLSVAAALGVVMFYQNRRKKL